MTTSEVIHKNRSKIVLQAVLGPLFILALLLLAAGRWDYWQAWTYTGLGVMLSVFNLITLRKNPELIQERLSPGEGQKKWDKLYFAITTPLFVIALVLGALDAGRFEWSPRMAWYAYGLIVIAYLVGMAIFLWAKATNRYFSTVVRIQQDRQQTVCREGPYAIVRHPGYLGGIIYTILTPLVLGSFWSLIPQGIAILLLIVRAKLEDDTLKKELPGYDVYANEVKYRLLPGIW